MHHSNSVKTLADFGYGFNEGDIFANFLGQSPEFSLFFQFSRPIEADTPGQWNFN